jgi:biopolymer transport protein ExbD
MKPFISQQKDGDLGFQIAPMIDVVFVIMLFFMVMAGSIKTERELNSQLPGNAETSGATEFVDEQVITISEPGEIALNDEPLSPPGDTKMERLIQTLKNLKFAGDQAKSPTLVTVVSEAKAKYSRTVDVLDALAAAGISNVTFTVNEEE